MDQFDTFSHTYPSVISAFPLLLKAPLPSTSGRQAYSPLRKDYQTDSTDLEAECIPLEIIKKANMKGLNSEDSTLDIVNCCVLCYGRNPKVIVKIVNPTSFYWTRYQIFLKRQNVQLSIRVRGR